MRLTRAEEESSDTTHKLPPLIHHYHPRCINSFRFLLNCSSHHFHLLFPASLTFPFSTDQNKSVCYLLNRVSLSMGTFLVISLIGWDSTSWHSSSFPIIIHIIKVFFIHLIIAILIHIVLSILSHPHHMTMITYTV